MTNAEMGEEVTDPHVAEAVCEGLAHRYRFKVFHTLKKHGGFMKLIELIKECIRDPEYYRHFATAKGHIQKMAMAGIVDLRKEAGEYVVELKKDVKIFVRDFEPGGDVVGVRE